MHKLPEDPDQCYNEYMKILLHNETTWEITMGKRGSLPEWMATVSLDDYHYPNIVNRKSYFVTNLRKWCAENCQSMWGTFQYGSPHPGRTFFFEDADEAAHFKMVWA